MYLMDEESVIFLIERLNKKIDTMREDHPNPIGASHAKTKQDAYYNGLRAGLHVAQRCIVGDE